MMIEVHHRVLKENETISRLSLTLFILNVDYMITNSIDILSLVMYYSRVMSLSPNPIPLKFLLRFVQFIPIILHIPHYYSANITTSSLSKVVGLVLHTIIFITP